MNIYKEIYGEIKKAKKIVLARHIGPDPDALGSTLGLKELILNTFPEKEVYVVGHPASRFKFIGEMDKLKEIEDALLIVTDTPDASRIDGIDISNFKKSIKIDHHPFVEKTCMIEWIDESSTSACQMIIELALNTKLKINKEAAEKLYTGLISDSNRFLFKYSNSKTFYLVSKLLEKTELDITKIYANLYARPYKEIKFFGYLAQNFTITDNKVGYVIVTDKELKKFEVDSATPGNMVNDFNYIDEMLVWVTFSYDKDLKTYRTSIRSRGPIINEVAANYGGGGHIYASGARLKDEKEIKSLINDLDKVTKEYLENSL